MVEHRTIACERARMWAALAPDAELSGFERRLLAAHLERCADCAAFAAGVDVLTEEIRSTAPEPVPFRIAVSGTRRRLVRRARGIAVPSAAAAAVVLGTIAIGTGADVPQQGASTEPLILVVRPSDDNQILRDLRQARREQLIQSNGNADAEQTVRPGPQPA